jgi:hypothetical protein
VRALKFLILAEIIVAILKMFLLSPFAGLYELFTCLILWMAYAQLSYCSVIMYVIFSLFNLIACFVLIATRLQNGGEFWGTTNFQALQVGFIIFLIFFHFICMYVAFLAYREF